MARDSKVVTFYETDVLPVVMANAGEIFPEFDFRLMSKGYEGGPNASDSVREYFGCRPERILLMRSRPGLLAVADGQCRQLTAYVLKSYATPKGEDLTKAIMEIAKLAGVDTSPIDGTTMSDQDRRDRDERMARLRKEAEEKRERDEELRKIQDQEAIKRAINFIAKANDFTAKHSRGLAASYFARRGITLAESGPRGVPETMLCIGNAGINGRPEVGALVFPMVDEHDRPIGCQRVFVDPKGRKTTIEIKDGEKVSHVSKATLGRCDGSRFTIGEGYPHGVCVVVEGAETGLAIHASTGFRIECGISAGGMEKIKLRQIDIDHGRISCIIVAGDLDRSLRGQQATPFAADRLRSMYKIPVVEMLPNHELVPELVGEDGLPANDAKSVDWDDVHRECGPECLADAFDDAIGRATADLQHAAGVDVSTGDGFDGPDGSDHDDQPAETKASKTRNVLPKNDLYRACDYIRERHCPSGSRATSLVFSSGRFYRWDSGVYIELGEPSVLRGEIRRWARHKTIEKWDSKEEEYIYPMANLNKSQIASISDAVVDECSVLIHADDFSTQYWLTSNIDDQGLLDIETPCWSRRIADPNEAGLPVPEQVVSVENGMLNLDSWHEHEELELMPHTPSFFTLSKVGVEFPIAKANKALADGGIDALRTLGESMCPDFIKFLTATFHDDEDERAAPETMREIFKLLGYYLTGDLVHHEANICWLHGPAGTGKSTLKNVICAFLGVRNTVSSNMHKITQQFHLASWIGKLLAVFADLDQGSRGDKTTNTEIFKMIATGDGMSVDRKHRDEIPNHIMKTRLLCLVNQMPHMPDPSNSLLRRSFCLDFKNIPEKDAIDPHLELKMTTTESLAGILVLAIVGLADLKADGGFIQPEWSAEPLEQLAEQSSDYPDFIEQCVLRTNNKTVGEGEYKGDFVAAEDLYDAFCGYLTSVGTKHHPKRHRMLSELVPVLTAMEWQKVKQGRVTLGGKASSKGYRGLKLTQTGLDFARAHHGEPSGAGDGDAGNSFLPT